MVLDVKYKYTLTFYLIFYTFPLPFGPSIQRVVYEETEMSEMPETITCVGVPDALGKVQSSLNWARQNRVDLVRLDVRITLPTLVVASFVQVLEASPGQQAEERDVYFITLPGDGRDLEVLRAGLMEKGWLQTTDPNQLDVPLPEE